MSDLLVGTSDQWTWHEDAERQPGARLSTVLRAVWRPYGATREQLSVYLFSGALSVNFRICRAWHVGWLRRGPEASTVPGHSDARTEPGLGPPRQTTDAQRKAVANCGTAPAGGPGCPGQPP